MRAIKKWVSLTLCFVLFSFLCTGFSYEEKNEQSTLSEKAELLTKLGVFTEKENTLETVTEDDVLTVLSRLTRGKTDDDIKTLQGALTYEKGVRLFVTKLGLAKEDEREKDSLYLSCAKANALIAEIPQNTASPMTGHDLCELSYAALWTPFKADEDHASPPATLASEVFGLYKAYGVVEGAGVYGENEGSGDSDRITLGMRGRVCIGGVSFDLPMAKKVSFSYDGQAKDLLFCGVDVYYKDKGGNGLTEDDTVYAVLKNENTLVSVACAVKLDEKTAESTDTLYVDGVLDTYTGFSLESGDIVRTIDAGAKGAINAVLVTRWYNAEVGTVTDQAVCFTSLYEGEDIGLFQGGTCQVDRQRVDSDAIFQEGEYVLISFDKAAGNYFVKSPRKIENAVYEGKDGEDQYLFSGLSYKLSNRVREEDFLSSLKVGDHVCLTLDAGGYLYKAD